MKTLGIVLVLLLVGLLAGCRTPAESGSERDSQPSFFSGWRTPAESADERSLRMDQASKQQWRMFVDDWDYFWLLDRSTRLSRYHVEIGD